MLRIYCLQQWYNLSDPGAEEALYDIQSMRAFCNLEVGRDPIPDETTILNFRHLLEARELTKTVFEAVAEYLEARGALLRGGTIVDATLIAASPSDQLNAHGVQPLGTSLRAIVPRAPVLLASEEPSFHAASKLIRGCVSQVPSFPAGLGVCCSSVDTTPAGRGRPCEMASDGLSEQSAPIRWVAQLKLDAQEVLTGANATRRCARHKRR